MNYPPLQGMRLVLVTLALSLSVFMEVLDSTIANVAVPVIAGDLGAAMTQGTWVITSFAVANAISIPLTGFMARRFGEVRLFIFSVLGFVFTSWLCGMAHNLELMQQPISTGYRGCWPRGKELIQQQAGRPEDQVTGQRRKVAR